MNSYVFSLAKNKPKSHLAACLPLKIFLGVLIRTYMKPNTWLKLVFILMFTLVDQSHLKEGLGRKLNDSLNKQGSMLFYGEI